MSVSSLTFYFLSSIFQKANGVGVNGSPPYELQYDSYCYQPFAKFKYCSYLSTLYGTQEINTGFGGPFDYNQNVVCTRNNQNHFYAVIFPTFCEIHVDSLPTTECICHSKVPRFSPNNVTFQTHNHLHVFEDTDCNSLFNGMNVSQSRVVNYRTNEVCVGTLNGTFEKNYPLKAYHSYYLQFKNNDTMLFPYYRDNTYNTPEFFTVNFTADVKVTDVKYYSYNFVPVLRDTNCETLFPSVGDTSSINLVTRNANENSYVCIGTEIGFTNVQPLLSYKNYYLEFSNITIKSSFSFKIYSADFVPPTPPLSPPPLPPLSPSPPYSPPPPGSPPPCLPLWNSCVNSKQCCSGNCDLLYIPDVDEGVCQ